MKLKKHNDKAYLSITKNDWIRIAAEAKWPIPEDMMDGESLHPDPPFKIEVRKYGPRHFAVYLNGDLLCVTVYKKGALAVESTLGELAQRIQEAEGMVRMVG